MTPTELYALKPYLSDADYKTVLTAAKPAKEAKAKDPKVLDAAMMNRTLTPRLESLGLDPNAKVTSKKTKGDIPQIYAIQRSIIDAVLYEQEIKGRPLTQDEMSKTVDREFLRTRANTKTGFFGTGGDRKRLFDMQVKDILPSERKIVMAALDKKGITDPSDAEILNIYYLMDAQQRRRK
jgi:hypothetical protein